MKIFEWSPIELVSRLAEGRHIEYNFASGSPDPVLIPYRELRDLLVEVLEEYGARALLYPGAGGLPELVSEIERFLGLLGVSVGRDEEVVVVSGSQHGIKILSQILVGPGDTVVVEDPTFWEAVYPFRFHGASLRGLVVDVRGADPQGLEDIVKSGVRVAAVYLNPTCHNPTGYTMDIERRRHLLEIAERHDLLVIEDDPYRPIARDPPPPLKTLDRSGRVVYLGSMSKILAPGLRIGFVVAGRELAEKIRILVQHDFSTSTLLQLLVARALRSGLVSSLMSRAHRHYDEKRRVLLDTLTEYFPESFTEPSCGFFSLLYTERDAERCLERAIERGLLYVPARRFFIERPRESIRLSIGVIPSERIPVGLRILREVLS